MSIDYFHIDLQCRLLVSRWLLSNNHLSILQQNSSLLALHLLLLDMKQRSCVSHWMLVSCSSGSFSKELIFRPFTALAAHSVYISLYVLCLSFIFLHIDTNSEQQQIYSSSVLGPVKDLKQKWCHQEKKNGEEAAALKDETQQLSPELRELHMKKLLKQIMSEVCHQQEELFISQNEGCCQLDEEGYLMANVHIEVKLLWC